MRVQLDANVRTSDGQRAGNVKRVVFDPKRNEVTAYVVGTGGLLGHDVIVSPDVLERGATGEDIVIDMTKDELSGLERYDEGGYAPAPNGWLAPSTYTYPAGSYLFPLDPAIPPPAADVGERRPRRPAITEGMKVKDASGAVIGAVREVRVDDMTGELRSIVVRDDGPLARDEDAMEIPADHIDIGDGEIQVIEQGGRASAAGREGA